MVKNTYKRLIVGMWETVTGNLGDTILWMFENGTGREKLALRPAKQTRVHNAAVAESDHGKVSAGLVSILLRRMRLPDPRPSRSYGLSFEDTLIALSGGQNRGRTVGPKNSSTWRDPGYPSPRKKITGLT